MQNKKTSASQEASIVFQEGGLSTASGYGCPISSVINGEAKSAWTGNKTDSRQRYAAQNCGDKKQLNEIARLGVFER
ncbi:MAG TPA: hypothetical protein VEV84_07950, partial [Pyrinomonadaceae bacterium]|nr:hypothetical protein [Pyrinomonadaceae bacterium]